MDQTMLTIHQAKSYNNEYSPLRKQS